MALKRAEILLAELLYEFEEKKVSRKRTLLETLSNIMETALTEIDTHCSPQTPKRVTLSQSSNAFESRESLTNSENGRARQPSTRRILNPIDDEPVDAITSDSPARVDDESSFAKLDAYLKTVEELKVSCIDCGVSATEILSTALGYHINSHQFS